jgi:electron transfer flavoprotein alpha subunit
MAVLLIGEHNLNGDLSEVTARTLFAARKISSEVDILLVSPPATATSDAAAKLEGVRQVCVCDIEPVAEEVAALVVSRMDVYDALLVPATASGRNIAPRIAAMLDVTQISEITAIKSANEFEHPIYAGNVLETVRSTDEKKVITVRTTAFPPVETGTEIAPVVEILAPCPASLAKIINEETNPDSGLELTSANIVIAGGRGIGSADNFRLLEQVAKKLGAAVGASRAAVDAGFSTNDRQVGQTGKIIAPDIYIAVGISGAIQHLAGVRDAKTLVAVNSDPEAPIFQVADYGIVGDAANVLTGLLAELPL